MRGCPRTCSSLPYINLATQCKSEVHLRSCLIIALASIFQRCVAFNTFHGPLLMGLFIRTVTVQARAQSQLLGQLLPMVAQLPSAQARCDALARIWAAAVASDLETRRAVRTRQKTLPGAELKQLLSDTFAMEVISGSSEGQ